MNTILRMWRSHRILFLAFLAAAGAAMFFALRLVVFTLYWAAHSEEPIKGWMTPGYVERSWDLPRRSLAGALDLTPLAPGQHPQTIAELAADRGITVADMVVLVERAVAEAALHRSPR